eukprot:Blabericola_migrator_1__1471@NODE_1388_length_4639_cov_45_054243_g334_i1_p1_GENE_NODE_1388_length_4639_cov_45_054243_g334_i1NODE_1388_length_4639_cov_45_054243_g334_i1_p1_ORF_typecomplete_len371_score33_67Metallophos/PF00149_28/0_00067DBR1/PF05011_13/0_19_NODE_1388_length_4639_cov_45_054243_g334_i134534565
MSSQVALQGCVHGDINRCYDAVRILARKHRVKAILWGGDVQTARFPSDLDSLACPPKYRALKDFHEYYNGVREAPLLTLFIGGNHEASSFLHSLYFGGWVAPNMWYMGRSGVVVIDGHRIAGLSGIYKYHDYQRGYFETPPFDAESVRSICHVRELEVKKLATLDGPVNLVFSHDWPTDVVQTDRDQAALLRKKPFFERELAAGELGNPHLSSVLCKLRPPIWMAAHLHVNFQCRYLHTDGRRTATTFVAHDKPKRTVSTSLASLDTGDIHFCCSDLIDEEAEPVAPKRFRQVPTLEVDLEWLAIVKISWADLSVSPTSREINPSIYKITWGVVNRIAASVEAANLAKWTASLAAYQEPGKEPIQVASVP